jgi:hypothetical protein
LKKNNNKKMRSSFSAKSPPLSASSPFGNPLEQLQNYENHLKQILNNSLFLKPIHVEVSNVSCWYYMRKKLKAKKHSAIIIKPNATKNVQEGYIYDLKRREEDLNIVPTKTLVLSAEDRWMVFKKCEEAMRERDKQRIILEESSLYDRKSLVLTTHVKITVVSESFYRMKPMERLLLVYSELLSKLGINVKYDGEEQHDDNNQKNNKTNYYRSFPKKMKGFSHFGENVCHLPIFRFLDTSNNNNTSTVFLITAITPSQWRPNDYRPPLSERLGETHLGAAVLQVAAAAKPKSQKERIKKLTTPVKADNGFLSSSFPAPAPASAASNSRPTTSENNNNPPSSSPGKEKNPTTTNPNQVIADSLGLDPSISGVKYKKLGGIYGHFFNDLSTEVRDLVMLKYENNRELIRDESRAPPPKKDPFTIQPEEELTFQPKTNAHRFKTKAQIMKDGLNDKGTTNMIEMNEEINISNRRMILAAIRIQRIRRQNLYTRLVKLYWRQQWGAITIQRMIRGRFGRRYFSIFRKLRPVAAIKLQRIYRSIISQRILDHWQFLVYRMTRKILPRMKKFIQNCYLSWISRREKSAMKIQNCVRHYLSKNRFYWKLGKLYFFQQLFQKSAITIQKIMRTYLSKKRFQLYLHNYLITYIDVPAVIRIQRIFRGRLAKNYLAFLKYERKCLLLMQKTIKRFVHNVWNKELAYQRKLKKSAINLQRCYRGYYDRKLYKLKYFFFFYTMIYIPKTLKLQSVIRGFLARMKVSTLKQRYHAAKTIQTAYRNYKNYCKRKAFRRQLLELFRNKTVIVIQKYYRRYITRKKYRRWITVQRGREIYAAKLIYRTWKLYQLNQKYALLLEDYRIQEEEKLLTKYENLKKNITLDIKEIQTDITLTEKTRDRLKKRLGELDTFLVQAAFRLNKIKAEMKTLTMDDFEKGWAESFGQEYETIQHQSLLGREELRLIRHKLYIAEEELFSLYLEYEENELEMDSLDQIMIQIMEKSRLRQIMRMEKKANAHSFKEIFREKVHWKITSNRSKKILNNRQRYQDILKETSTGRPMEYFTTVDFEKRQRRRDYETLMKDMALKNEMRERDIKAKPKT